MADTGATYPGLGSNEDRAGLPAWSNPTYIQAGANAASWSGTDIESDWLRGSTFGFSVPTDATILGVKLDMYRIESAGSIANILLYLVDSDGVNTGNSKHVTNQYWAGVETVSYGGASDLWGATLTPAIVNSANFGARMSVGGIGASTATVGWYKITVYYTDPPTTTIVAATSITATTARINAEVLNDGGAACEGRFCWGEIETEDDFEWGSDADPLSDRGGGIDWLVTALGTSRAEIDEAQHYAGTRSARLYRDGTNQPRAYFAQTPLTSSQVLSVRVRKDATSGFTLYHGNGTKVIMVGYLADETLQWYDTGWNDTGASIAVGAWALFEVRNVDWDAGTYDIYQEGDLAKTGAIMRTNTSWDSSMNFYNAAGTSECWIDNVRVLANRTTTAFANGLTTSSPFHSDLTSLTPGTKHVYEAQLQNSEEGLWSSEATFRTILEKLLSDTVTISDSIMKTASLNKADSVSVSDSIVKSVTLAKDDAVAVGDTIVKRISLIKADSVAVADSILKTIGLHKSESVSIADAISKTVSLVKAESVTITDSISKRVTLVKTEAVAIADSIRKTVSLIKADTVAIADVFDRTVSYVLSLADNVGITDSISKTVSIIKADAVAITDAINVSLARIHAIHLSDVVTISDRLVGELRVKTYLKQSIARMQIKGMDIAKMSINKMGIARMPLFRWIIRRWTA